MSSLEKIVSFRDLCMYFGGVKAIDHLSFEVEKGEIYGIIGPNGAGKSTIFNVMTGVYKPTSGEAFFRDRKLNDLKPHEITGSGIARTFQNIRLFDSETVLDNLKVAMGGRSRYNVADVLLTTRKFREEEERIEEECMDVLRQLRLDRYANVLAGSLPYGEQRRVEMARALCCRPEVLLLDEPAAGMNPTEVDSLNDLITGIRERWGLTVMVVEHQMRLVMSICERILVVNFGKKLIEGRPDEVRNDPSVLEAYLGRKREEGAADE